MAKYVITTPPHRAQAREKPPRLQPGGPSGSVSSRRAGASSAGSARLGQPSRPTEHIVRSLRDLPREIVAPVAAALDVPLATPEVASEEAKRGLDAHLHAVAESADVSARRARAVVIAVLDKAGELRLSIAQARELMKA